MKYKHLNRFSTIFCAECSGQECLTVNEYTEEVLCTACLTDLIDGVSDGYSKKDYEEMRGDELRCQNRDNKPTGDL